MRPRILCSFHEEKTPSMVLYDKYYHCFSCGAHGPLEALGLSSMSTSYVDDKPQEDIKESMEYIKSLPKEIIRGLYLHTNERNYYIVWPGYTYYKSRSKSSEDNSKKYKCPYGVSKPSFFIKSSRVFSWYKKTLLIIEGELNALSVAECLPFIDVMSPGGAGDFTSANTKKQLPFFQQYSKILILADNDKAGAEAAIGLTGFLRANGIKTSAKLMDKDANEILTSEGRGKLEEVIRLYLADVLKA